MYPFELSIYEQLLKEMIQADKDKASSNDSN